MYRLSAQLSIINKEHISSIGELEGRIKNLNDDYNKHKAEVNALIEEHNRMESLLEQVQEFFALSKKTELSDKEQLRKTLCKQAMERNNVL